MKKCDCKIMNTLSRYPKVWPWLGVAGYALDGAELVLKHTRWGKMNYKARMLVHGAGAGCCASARACTRRRRPPPAWSMSPPP